METERAAATAGQLTRRNEELAKSLEVAEGAKAALEEEKRTLTARVEDLERSLSVATSVRRATSALKDLQVAVDDWKISHAAGSPMLK